MIKTFQCRDTQALFEGGNPRRFQACKAAAERKLQMLDSASAAERKLQMLDSASAAEDIRVPPGNRLESLRGDRKGKWSIRINDKWRACFRFKDGNAFDVEIVDYH